MRPRIVKWTRLSGLAARVWKNAQSALPVSPVAIRKTIACTTTLTETDMSCNAFWIILACLVCIYWCVDSICAAYTFHHED